MTGPPDRLDRARARLDPARRRTILRLAPRARGPAGAPGGMDLVASARGGLEFVGHRPWREGDDPRLLDAAASARSGRPIARELRTEAAQQCAVVLDTGAALSVGNPSKWQRACELALWFAAAALRARGRCALIAPGAPDARALPTVASWTGWHALADALCELQPHGAAAFPSAALARACGPARRVVLISDFLRVPPRAWRAFVRPGRELIAVCVRAPEELLCADFEPARLIGKALCWREPGGTGVRTTHPEASDLLELRARIAAHDEALEKGLRAQRSRWLRVRSDEPLEALLERRGA